MQGFKRPKSNPIGSTHSLAQLGAISNPNVPLPGSTPVFTRPSQTGVVMPSGVNINSPVLHTSSGEPALPTRPKANPVGVSAPITSRIATPLGHGRVNPFPINYPHAPEE